MAIRGVTWFEARKEIKRACNENPEVSYLKVCQDHKDGFCQIWGYEGCYLVTRVDKESDGRVFVICLLAGSKLFEWGYELEKELQRLAKAYNCPKIKVIGRKGWERLLTPLGFKVQSIEMVKYVEQNENRYHYPREQEQARSAYGSPLVWRRPEYGTAESR
jgi:hypothetical protein